MAQEEYARGLSQELTEWLQSKLGQDHGEIVTGFAMSIETQDMEGNSTNWTLSTVGLPPWRKCGLLRWAFLMLEKGLDTDD